MAHCSVRPFTVNVFFSLSSTYYCVLFSVNAWISTVSFWRIVNTSMCWQVRNIRTACSPLTSSFFRRTLSNRSNKAEERKGWRKRTSGYLFRQELNSLHGHNNKQLMSQWMSNLSFYKKKLRNTWKQKEPIFASILVTMKNKPGLRSY